MNEYLVTSESVTEGHPDKLCDQISDGILDRYLEQDPDARVAVETMVSKNTIMIAGEISARVELDVVEIAREIVQGIGYDNEIKGLDFKTCLVLTNLNHQSSDIARGVEQFITHEPAQWVLAGRFVIGGPLGDTGPTGRKIMVDTYGGVGKHGGGAFSGKDPTKVDRIGAYMARYMAKNIVAAGLADRCEVSLAYAIGLPEPEAIGINTFGTEHIDRAIIESRVRDRFSFSVNNMIKTLKLKRPQFLKTAAYGHFGREDEGFAWEELDRVECLLGNE
ncbi:methionine adenosyltransferase domain-containing protein [Acetobacterium carbinolicum]|uniref:methionine adenosyltransferase domain-containing protein n=1 Tax=Acetobacterium carbinolicum TaxID=52690 RepID=UPI0039BF3814